MKKYISVIISAMIVNALFANLEQWDYENLDGRDFRRSGDGYTYSSIRWASAKNTNWEKVGLQYAKLTGTDFTGATFYYGSLYQADLTDANLTNACLIRTYMWANLTNTILKNTDLRGAVLLGSCSGTPIIQNTIWDDGVIRNFLMKSSNDSFFIRKYVPPVEGERLINAKIADDASISGGAVLTLEQGAVLEIASGKTLSVLDDSEIIFNVDAAASDATKILLGENSKLVFGSDSKITINLDGVISPDDSYTFSVIETVAGSQVIGTDSLKKENVILNINGEAYDSEKWGFDFDPSTGSLNINVNVPEPATYAAIFGALALAFAAYRRRK